MLNLFRRSPPPCIFCDIIAGTPSNSQPDVSSSAIPLPPPPPATVLLETPSVVAIADKYPASKHHFLVLPKEHIANAKCLTAEHSTLWEEMTRIGEELVRTKIEDEADRTDVVMGCTWPPFTTVPHLHLHVVSPASRMSGLSKYVAMTPWFVYPDWIQNRLEGMKT